MPKFPGQPGRQAAWDSAQLFFEDIKQQITQLENRRTEKMKEVQKINDDTRWTQEDEIKALEEFGRNHKVAAVTTLAGGGPNIAGGSTWAGVGPSIAGPGGSQVGVFIGNTNNIRLK
ncbi:ATP-dependent zinc metalloprotease FTSH 9, chloroplastic [Folsomia candida]|uniref:ATP-dependent zinc metalloprotease FTSH 9, chloroplastic n=1 Tax=Folsomia candida TaxID=158441 RepID=A0A226EBJ0_FOLCA|nr:ATP-dependent zinc metalloprotease FTSH 9, chloroplastic [Folsomia candida]